MLGAFLGLTAVATLLLAPVAALAADPGGSAGKSSAVTLEPIPGGDVKRVILTAKAAERLGIETGKVGEQVVVRKQMVGGLITPPMEKLPESGPAPASGGFGGFGQEPAAPAPQPGAAPAPVQPPVSAGAAAPVRQPVSAIAPAPLPVAAAAQAAAPAATSPTAGEVWVLTTLSPAEWDKLAKDKPARLLPLGTRDKLEHEVLAQPSGIAPIEDVKRSMLQVYYVVAGKDHGLTVNSRMRVELPLSGSEEKQKVVPYSAVHYDAKGTAWVYVNTKPLVFERRRVDVERVVGDLAVLSSGPTVGTPVVTVGVPMLHGAEVFGK
ncbi:hypothetical protein DWG20_12585 [Crenobacter cavernae]|uniref:Efflux RND transporter periplasmic adaptor subunit n=1 Tax=Crenobacter cavernae TaxID=2290923 RepID=A0A345Y8F7_9NEIS|nr:hypothetical protein DWG20_12585 [Crenobacter cavernae]